MSRFKNRNSKAVNRGGNHRKLRADAGVRICTFESLEDRRMLAGDDPYDHYSPPELVGKIQPQLWAVVGRIEDAVANETFSPDSESTAPATIEVSDIANVRVRQSGAVQVYADLNSFDSESLGAIDNLGLQIEASDESSGVAQLWVPYDSVDDLASLANVTDVSIPEYATVNTGIVDTAGDGVLNADDVRARFTAATGNLIDGSGIRVGVISTGVDHRAQSQGGSNADLPSITIDPGLAGSGDEGTAMLEIIHDLAPGAQLYFAGPSTAVDMTSAINWMIGQNLDVIVDDLGFYNEGFFVDTSVANAVRSATNAGITYVTAAGNDAQSHYQGVFHQSGQYHDFNYQRAHGSSADTILDIGSVPAGGVLDAFLQWSDPWGASHNNYDLQLVNTSGTTIYTQSVTVQSGAQNPSESVHWVNPFTFATNVGLRVVAVSSPTARELEIFVEPRNFAFTGITDPNRTQTDSIFGHQAVLSAITVGAVDYLTPTTIESFSSQGPSTIYNSPATSQTDITSRQSLDGVSVDDVNTYVGQNGYFDNPFFGTSAAAPHVAAIAALLLDENSTLTPAALSTLLAATAVDLTSYGTGYDPVSGAGRFDALNAVYKGYIPATPDLLNTSDSGVSDTDNYTNDTTPSFTGQAPAGSYVQLLMRIADQSQPQQVVGSFNMAANSTTYTIGPNTPIADGTYNFRIEVSPNLNATAYVSNQSANFLAVTIDATVPIDVTNVHLNPADDTGTSNSDGITNLNSVRIDGNCGTQSVQVIVYDNGSPIGTATASGGTWEFSTTLTTATHTITAKAVDAAGNISATMSAVRTVVVDRTAPAAPLNLTLTAATDSGSSNSDRITNVALPTFTWTRTEPTGSAARYYWAIDDTTPADSGNPTVSSELVTPPSISSDGTYTISVATADAAGNVGPATTIQFTIDRTPMTPWVPDLVSSDDHGTSDTDNITNQTTLHFIGYSELGSTVTILDGSTPAGTSPTDGGGQWVIVSHLNAGTHTLSARATDIAGNVSSPTTGLVVKVDTTAPRIEDVLLNGIDNYTSGNPSWVSSYSFDTAVAAGKQLKPVYTSGANRIQLVFDEQVNIVGSNLTLYGTAFNDAAPATDTSIGFLNVSSNIGEWTYNQLTPDKYRIHLGVTSTVTDVAGNMIDGEWANPPKESYDTFSSSAATFRSGNGSAGGDFDFLFAYLPGDYNRDGVVDAGDDVELVKTTTIDGSGDGVHNSGTGPDRAVFNSNFGKTLPATRTTGDYNLDDRVNQDDYSYWKSYIGNTSGPGLNADGNSNGTVDDGDYLIWRKSPTVYGAWYLPATGSAAARFFTESLPDDTTPPQVVNVVMSGSNSIHSPFQFDDVVGGGEQLRSVPVGGLDTIAIKFSEGVDVSSGDLTLAGMQSQTIPSVSGFAYDAGTFTATWTFASVLVQGQYLLRLSDSVSDVVGNKLDGEFVNPWSLDTSAETTSKFPSGDGHAGGEFRFRFTNFPGDFNGDNIADSGDSLIWTISHGATNGKSRRQGDADGDGDVDTTDKTFWQSQFGNDWTRWPSIEPGMILVSTATDELDSDYSYGDLSLREALAIADSDAGVDTIVFDPSVSTIDLTLGELGIGSDVIIDGLGTDRLTIDAQGNSRVVANYATTTIRDLTITGGGNVDVAAGILNYGGNLSLERVRLTGNATNQTTTAGNDSGGGIYSTFGSLHVIDSTIDHNAARWNGGIGYYADDAGDVLEISGSTINDNSAGAYGGVGVYSWSVDAQMTITNSTISGNTAGGVAGLFVAWSAHLTVINSTITNNQATGDYGGLFLNDSDSVLTLYNSIVAGNISTDWGGYNRDIAWWLGSFDPASSHNIIGVDGWNTFPTTDNLVGTFADPIDPRLAPLGNYGGLTQTHALLSDSPAIDAGDNDLAFQGSPRTTDQRGFARDIDVNNDASTDNTIDIGAFEFAAPITVSTKADEVDGYYGPGQLSLREAIQLASAIDGSDTINFDAKTFGANGIIYLNYQQLEINSDLTINGLGIDPVWIDAGGGSRAFQIDSGVTATIRNLTILDGVDVNGGNIYTAGQLGLEGVRLMYGSASDNGGGIYVADGNLVLTSSTVDGSATLSGGAIYVSDVASAVIVSSTINGGSASTGAGIFATLGDGQKLAISSSTISNNHAFGSNGAGGVVAIAASEEGSADVSLINSTIAANTGDVGGIFVSGTGLHLVMVNSTVAFNQGDVAGGLFIDDGASVTALNTIIAENLDSAGTTDNDVNGTLGIASAYNLLGRGGSGGIGNGTNNNIVLSATQLAGLAALDAYGGPTKTIALLNSSLAIDAGDDAVASAFDLHYDERGSDRFDDMEALVGVDIGAFELAADEFFGEFA